MLGEVIKRNSNYILEVITAWVVYFGALTTALLPIFQLIALIFAAAASCATCIKIYKEIYGKKND